MKKPQEARATPSPEHLLCSSNSTTYYLPVLSTYVVLSDIHQTFIKNIKKNFIKFIFPTLNMMNIFEKNIRDYGT
jgi:hypothetical protein